MSRQPLLAGAPRLPQPPPGKVFVLEHALAGRTHFDGLLITTLTGHETRFSVAMDGTWQENTMTIDEAFVFADGSTDRKTWTFIKLGEGAYRGKREDVLGFADVRQHGPCVRFAYRALLATPSGTFKLRFRDLLYMDGDGRVICKSVISKFGLRVANLVLTAREPARS